MKRLGVNIDHVATLRNARGGFHPDPLLAAKLAIKCGADSVTIHLREDRRHINDQDLIKICKNKKIPLNLEMGANMEIVKIALKNKPKKGSLPTYNVVATMVATIYTRGILKI